MLAAAARATTPGSATTKLRGGSGIQWPCTDEHPDGTERLYTDGVFPTDPDDCETYGHDLLTGAAVERSRVPGHGARTAGRSSRPPRTPPPHEEPDATTTRCGYTTGRTVYHFHTRTKTGRAPPLNAAAPDAVGGDVSRGRRRARHRRGRHGPGRVAARRDRGAGPDRRHPRRARSSRRSTTATGTPPTACRHRRRGSARRRPAPAANELTITEWDPVSKQPLFKTAAVRVEKLRSGDGPSKAPETTASRRATGAQR